MARPLRFQFGDNDFALHMTKVDRAKLYGFKEIEAIDESEAVCELATLADDGRTLIGKGGTGLGWLDADGVWCDKSALRPINVDGDEIVPVKSSFGTTIRLFDTATPAEYLEHNIRLVYSMSQSLNSDEPEGIADLADLYNELDKGTIFTFPYSYRGGLESDVAFLLKNADGNVMMAVGNQAQVGFVGIQSHSTAPADDGDDATEDDLNFDMI